MKNSIHSSKIFLAFSLILLTSACGGGGGSGDSNFAGTYDLTLLKVTDNCNAGLPNLTTLVNTVNQNNSTIALRSGSLDFVGSVNNENDGFSVVRSEPSSNCRSGGTVSSAFVYGPTDRDADYGVGYAIRSTCGAFVCEVSYGGTANRR